MESIFETVKNAALIQKSGGGTGFSFSKLRPKGDTVKSTGGVAAGPIFFFHAFDGALKGIKQAHRRFATNMGILNVDHPDILEFITSKQTEGILTTFNISVGITNKFMNELDNGGKYDLINPHTGKSAGKLSSHEVFKQIITNAWNNGEPGVIFVDRLNELNPTPHIDKIEATNPCGEQPLLPYESCNLGSIDVSKMIKYEKRKAKIDWDKLKETVRLAVHFLDNVIDANNYPLKETEMMTKANRKIGLGVMGFADLLIRLRIRYDSDEGLKTAERLMEFIQKEGHKKSQELGKERGSFPNFKGSTWDKKGYKHMRNATVTTVAPTSNLSIIAGCSSSIEPLFSIAYVRNVKSSLGQNLIEINPLFEKTMKERGFYSDELLAKVIQNGSVHNINEIPEEVKNLFVSAHDILPEWHVRMQATFQRFTDNAVSKTVNFPNHATPEDIEKVYRLAYKLGCKGVTVYRDGSRKVQIINTSVSTNGKSKDESEIEEVISQSGGCPTCHM
jgi:ribonucleoside-diphosphate reductase alpha chain